MACEFWGYGAISWTTNDITEQIITSSSEFFLIANNTVKSKHEVKGLHSFLFFFFFFEAEILQGLYKNQWSLLKMYATLENSEYG